MLLTLKSVRELKLIALIPIFLDKNNEFFTEPKGYELICLFLESVQNAKLIKRIVVVTNSEFIQKQLTNKFKAETFHIEICKIFTIERAGFLPYGSDLAIQYINKNALENSNLIILSFRNPLITSRFIDDAINKFFRTDRKTLISVKEIIDNPCQLASYYKLIDINLIFLVDTKADKKLSSGTLETFFNKIDGKNILITRPFYFDWDSKKISGRSLCNIYCREPGISEIKYVPIEVLINDEKQLCENYALFIYETRFSARLLSYSKQKIAKSQHSGVYSVAGISLSEDINAHFSIVRDENKKYFIHINKPIHDRETYLLKIYKITQLSQNDIPFLFEFVIESGNFLYEIPVDLHDFSGLSCSLFRYTENDFVDLIEPFKSTKSLWVDDGPNILINTKTGKKITGRQGFPEVFEPDGSFCIIKIEESKSFINSSFHKILNGYVLKENQSIQIQSELEYMHYRAVLRAKHL